MNWLVAEDAVVDEVVVEVVANPKGKAKARGPHSLVMRKGED